MIKKMIHSAFHQPLRSLSRNRSPMIMEQHHQVAHEEEGPNEEPEEVPESPLRQPSA